MTEFKTGQRVRVTYEGTVTCGTRNEEAKPIIRDDHGYTHYGTRPEYVEIITPPPPYVDGTLYADRAGTHMYFQARGYQGGPCWSYTRDSSRVYPYNYAQRPLRLITYGAEIQE